MDNVDNETDSSAEGWESNLWDDWHAPSQDFETNFDDYDTSNVEDFSVSTTVELFAIGTVIKVDLDPLLIDGFNINIHTSEEHAQGSLVGDLISEYVPIDEIYFDQLPNQPGNYRFIVNGYFSPTIAELPKLLPGDYWLSFTPVNNFSINDQTWMRYSNPNLAQSDAFGVSPGNGYGLGEVYSLNGPMPYVLTGDFNNDLEVGVDDLLELIASWGSCAGCEPDLNGDGEVGVDDLLELIANWGSCL
ncbi:MAG: hypothetical protein CMJ38_01010 [Phycisphaerae bacterium]|nr:hypothetical protein [Phycisphaerae bacterium]